MVSAAKLGGSCAFKGVVHLFTSPSVDGGSEKNGHRISIRPFSVSAHCALWVAVTPAACPSCLHGDQAAIHISALAPAAISELPISLIIISLHCGRRRSLIPSQSEQTCPWQPPGRPPHPRCLVRVIQGGLLELAASIEASAALRHLRNTAQAPAAYIRRKYPTVSKW